MFSWECREFFQAGIKHSRAAASLFTLLLKIQCRLSAILKTRKNVKEVMIFDM